MITNMNFVEKEFFTQSILTLKNVLVYIIIKNKNVYIYNI